MTVKKIDVWYGLVWPVIDKKKKKKKNSTSSQIIFETFGMNGWGKSGQ